MTKKWWSFIAGAVLLALSPGIVFAQAPGPLFGNTSVTPPAIGLPNLSGLFSPGTSTPQTALNFVVDLLGLIAGIAAFIYMLYGSYKYIMSGPSAAGAEEGKKMILGAVVGMVLVGLAVVIIRYVISII